jgi:hypothetical protein
MAVLIDPPIWPAHGRRWSHLVSDVSLRELHEFAAGLGIPERGFEGDHYDVPEERYAGTVSAGAIPVSGRELLRRLQASGLRRPKRRGERVLASRPDAVPGVRVDAVLSLLPPIGPLTALHAVVVAGYDLLVLPDDLGYRLPRCPLDAAERRDVVAILRDLVRSLVGPDAVAAPVARIGYLRRVDATRGTLLASEAVLRLALDTAVRPEPVRSDPGGDPRWVLAEHAVALLAGDVAPLAAGPAYRQRERAVRGDVVR